uniref:Formin-like protein 18 n=1 Tax=Kalanchoe fedtschenkoi TaxID=63787 RepID=A0A7N0V0R8_KALFE
MDPCPFARLTVANLALKIIPTSASRPSHHAAIHPTSSLSFCKIKLKKSPHQSAAVPILQPPSSEIPASAAAVTFHLSKDDVDRLVRKFTFAGKLRLKISVFAGSRAGGCGVRPAAKLLGKITVPLDLAGALNRPCLFHSGWVEVAEDGGGSSVQFHLTVRAEPDPRFVFQFDGEPECSPQVFQIQGRIRQPAFTCKFSCRSTIGDHTMRSRSLQTQSSSVSKRLLRSFNSHRERNGKERKGWSITVHDLSGSPVAVASMVTPFVASPNSDRVSRTNPGSWLILRPGDGTLKPWARLEAWRERATFDSLGLRFELVTEGSGPIGSSGIVLAESRLSSAKGGKFIIDLGSAGSSNSTTVSPRQSGDFGVGFWPYNGFVMSAAVEGEGKCSKPAVEVSVQHVGCMEDAAAFVAVAAAVDLSMDACRLFSHKLRKELTSQQQMFG